MAKGNLWGLLWHSENNLDGITRHLIFDKRLPALFLTQADARHYAEREFGYIKRLPNLRKEPHGWRMPQPVKVQVEEQGRG